MDEDWRTCPVSEDALPDWTNGDQIVYEPHGGSKFIAATPEQAAALVSILATLASWDGLDVNDNDASEVLFDMAGMLADYRTITA